MNEKFTKEMKMTETYEKMLPSFIIKMRLNYLRTQKQPNLKTGKTSVHQHMDKQNVVYTYNGTLFSFKKKGNSDMCLTQDEPGGHYAK